MQIKLQKMINSIVNYAVRALLIIVVAGLCLQSMYSTSFMGTITEQDGSLTGRTRNIADSPLKHLLVFVLCMAALVLIRRGWQRIREKDSIRRVTEKVTTGTVLKILYFFMAIAGCLLVIVTQMRAASDPLKVYDCALQWRDKNFSSFAEGGYLFRYPFQSGIVLFYYFASFILGQDNYIGLQLINVAALFVIYYLLARLTTLYWQDDKRIQVVSFIALAAWIPFSFYVTYLYGILPGMACALAAVYMTLRYLSTRKYRYMLFASLSIGIATILKSNCLIYLVAIICFLIYDIIVTSGMRNRLRTLLFVLFILLSYMGLNQAVYSYVEHLSGYEMPDGEVMVSWIVMGLSDAPSGPGNYNGYIGDVFTEYHYDTEKITEASLKEIQKILTRMAEYPHDEAIPFFAEKNAFQWNEPTFGGFEIIAGRSTAVTPPDAIRSLMTGKVRFYFTLLANYIQTQILLGALCYLLLHFHSKNLYELFGCVIFLGGFLFHFIWESSSTYTVPYFVILIPYAVKGWLDAVRCLDSFIRDKVQRKAVAKDEAVKLTEEKSGLGRSKIWRMVPLGAAVVCCILFFAFTRTNLFDRTIALDDGEEAREQFYQRGQVSLKGMDGYYLIAPYSSQAGGGDLVLSEQNGKIVTAAFESEQAQKIAIVMRANEAVLRFRGSEEVLAIAGEGSGLISYMDDSRNMFYDSSKKADYKWQLEKAEDGNDYYIVMNGQALTYDEEENEVCLEPYDRRNGQRWVLTLSE